MRECSVKGEKLLFRAIIVRAVKDAFSTVTQNTTISKLDKKQARYFLCEDPAFQDYCDYAGVSASRIRRISRLLNTLPDKEATALYRKLLRKEFKNEKVF